MNSTQNLILDTITKSEKGLTAKQVADVLKMNAKTVYNNVTDMLKADLVESRKEGVSVIYSAKGTGKNHINLGVKKEGKQEPKKEAGKKEKGAVSEAKKKVSNIELMKAIKVGDKVTIDEYRSEKKISGTVYGFRKRLGEETLGQWVLIQGEKKKYQKSITSVTKVK